MPKRSGNFGDVWKTAPPSMWEKFYKSEITEYAMFEKLLTEIKFDSVFELGCGDGRCAREYLKGKQYYGVDMGGYAIEKARTLNTEDCHTFECDDYYHRSDQRAELVMAICVIDSCLGVDKTIAMMYECSTKYVYFTTHYGANDRLAHKENTVANEISITQIKSTYPNVIITVPKQGVVKGWLINK